MCTLITFPLKYALKKDFQNFRKIYLSTKGEKDLHYELSLNIFLHKYIREFGFYRKNYDMNDLSSYRPTLLAVPSLKKNNHDTYYIDYLRRYAHTVAVQTC